MTNDIIIVWLCWKESFSGGLVLYARVLSGATIDGF